MTLEKLVAFTSIEFPFEDISTLKDFFSRGKTLCYNYNKDRFAIKIWYRENNSQFERFHAVVDPDQTAFGYLKLGKQGKIEILFDYEDGTITDENEKLYTDLLFIKLEKILL